MAMIKRNCTQYLWRSRINIIRSGSYQKAVMKVSCHGENPRLFPLLFQIILELAAGQSPRKSNWRPPWWNLHFWERKNMSTQEEGYPTNALSLSLKRPGSRLNIEIIFPGLQVFIVKLRRSWNHLIFIMGISILVRWHLYIESGHMALIQYKGVILLYQTLLLQDRGGILAWFCWY